MIPCRFCAAPAVVRFAFPQGCVCFPDCREAGLCLQHVVRATPLGEMRLLEILLPDVWEWFCREEERWA